MSKPIFLIGFMGAGKDTVGKNLAHCLGMGFLSTDRFIELAQAKTITEIFHNEGEAQFRVYEQSVLSKIQSLCNTVVATGGGIVVPSENHDLLKKCGVVVQVAAPLEMIQERLRECSTRPLALSPDHIARVYRDREGMYDFADITVTADRRSPEQIAEQILLDLNIAPLPLSFDRKDIMVKTPSASCLVACGTRVMSDKSLLKELIGNSSRVCIVSNPLVSALYFDPIQSMFSNISVRADHVIVPDGEQFKTKDSISKIHDHLMTERFNRKDLVIGLGGGVISDLTGFAAATFKRGMRCAFISTTLLGQVDAAIGGKNGINHDQGKNMIGTFYQPECVINDVNVLRTLPEIEFRNGLAEIIKYAVIHDSTLFSMLEQQSEAIKRRDPALLMGMIMKCVSIKGAIVAQDERENLNLRQQLNFGHTIGHAIETLTQFQEIPHGQAVAIGMAAEAKAAMDNGYLDKSQYDRIIGVIAQYELPYELPNSLTAHDMKTVVLHDKKAFGETIIMPIPTKIGTVLIKEVSCKTYL